MASDRLAHEDVVPTQVHNSRFHYTQCTFKLRIKAYFVNFTFERSLWHLPASRLNPQQRPPDTVNEVDCGFGARVLAS